MVNNDLILVPFLKMDRWWRINHTLLDKLQDTGYHVSDDAREQVSSLEAFTTAFPNADTDMESMGRVFRPINGTMAELRSPNGVYLAFSVSEGKTIKTDHVSSVIEQIERSRASTCFYVINKPLYHTAKKHLDAVSKIYRIVIFQQTELLFNPSRHKRVPKHELLTPAEASRWLGRMELKKSQLPRIFEDDAQVKYWDAVAGDLFRVTNPSPTVGSFSRILTVVRKTVS